MNKRFLLTYQNNDGSSDYGWFESEDEVRTFIAESDIKVDECLEIGNVRTVEL